MTTLDEYAGRLQEIAHHFAKSATTATSRIYAAELLTDEVLPSRKLTLTQSKMWVEVICAAQDIDPPRIERMHTRRNFVGAACSEEHAIALFAAEVSQLTLLHELAHLLAPESGHGVEFRTQFVALARRHISIEHASLLQTLFGLCGQPARWTTTHN